MKKNMDSEMDTLIILCSNVPLEKLFRVPCRSMRKKQGKLFSTTRTGILNNYQLKNLHDVTLLASHRPNPPHLEPDPDPEPDKQNEMTCSLNYFKGHVGIT